MRSRSGVAILLSTAALACGGAAPAAAPAAPPALAVTVPSQTSVVYVQGDTAVVDVDAGGQTFTVNATTTATLGVDFAAAPGGVQVTTTFRDFQATLTNPMAPTQTADEQQISGPLVFTLDRRGQAAVVTPPQLEGTAAEFLSPEEVAARLIPRLPGRAVVPGDSWVDTIRVESDSPTTSVSARTVLTSRAVGDTVVGGRSFLLVRFSGEAEQASEGSQGGFDVTQNVKGTTEGHFLWDMGRGLLWYSESRSDLRGTMEVSAAPFPLSIRIRGVSKTNLQET